MEFPAFGIRYERRLGMKRSKFSEGQVLGILKAVENGRTVGEVCREHSISESTYFNWKAKYGGMTAAEIKRAAGAGGRESAAKEDVR